MILTEPVTALRGALRVTLRLGQDVLRAEGDPLGLNNTEKLTVDEQGIVGRSVLRLVFGDRMVRQLRRIEVGAERHNHPTV